MQLGGSFYAAKLFYDLGGWIEAPSHRENLEHLKEELLRQRTIGQALQRFNTFAQTHKISVFGAYPSKFSTIWETIFLSLIICI